MAPTLIHTLSLHDALPISAGVDHRLDQLLAQPPRAPRAKRELVGGLGERPARTGRLGADHPRLDRKSTRLNSSHVAISYAVFCLKKKKKISKKTSSECE